MMRCAAIDDEPLALKQIAAYIERTPFLEMAAAYPGAMEAVGDLAERDIDLLFIDINMPGLSGLDFVRALPDPPMVVFTTAYSEYAIDGFRLDATDYLLKPIGYADFLRAAEKAHKRFLQDHKLAAYATDPTDRKTARNAERLFVKSEYRTVPVEIAAIDHIESMGEYMRIHTVGEKTPVTTLGRLHSMAESLPAGDFMRVHRTYLVNLHRIAAVERGVIITSGGARIPVSEQYKDEFKSYLDKNSLSK